MTRYAILEAPSVLGLFPAGVQDLPEALLRAGLAAALGARHAGRVEAPEWRPERDPATGLRNAGAIAAYARDLSAALGPMLDAGEVPVVLGGDCSILLGPLLALRRRGGRHGLLFLDGHADSWPPTQEPRGEAASCDLLLATGGGPDLLGTGALVRAADVVLLGRRDVDGDDDGPTPPPPAGVLDLPADAVRAGGAEAAAAMALARLARPGLDGFWVHLDADVLDDAAVPAVDYRMPGGLSLVELGAVLRAAMASGRVLGLHVTILNPRLDTDGRAIAALMPALVRGLAGERRDHRP
jgi:arginase